MSAPTRPRILAIVTSHDTLGDTGRRTGFYVPELHHPVQALRDALGVDGFTLTIASPAGGTPPRDGVKGDDAAQAAFLAEPAIAAMLADTLRTRDIDPREHDTVLFVGGHGTMWDFASDEAIATIIREIDAQGGIVAAVCHGPAALVQATRADGTPLVAGRRIATFTDAEERAVGLHETVPFLLESTLAARGAQVTAAAPWQANVVVDGRLITGQNPASARGVGEAMAAVLAARVPHAA